MPAPSMSTRVVRGLLWTGSPFVLQILITLLFYSSLKMGEMGQYEYALVIVMFLALLSSLGLGEALVQYQAITDRHFSSAFWVAILCGVAIVALVNWIAPVAMDRFDFFRVENPEQFEWIVSTLVLLVPFAAVSGIFRARLQRDLEFRSMAIAEVVGIIAFAVAAIILLPSHGIRTPVISSVVREVALCLSLWLFCRWVPRFTVDLGSLRAIMSFGLHFTGSRCVNYTNSNLARFFIFPTLGEVAMGYYSFAHRLTLLPLTRLSTVVTRVFFPTFSTVQSDEALLRRGYLQTVQSIALFTWPLVIILGVFAPQLMLAMRQLDGNDMSPALGVLRLLLLATAIKSVGAAVGSMFMAKGRADWTLYWSLFSFVVLVPSLMWGVSQGIEGIAGVIATTALLFLVLSQHFTNRLIQIGFADYLRPLTQPALVAGCTGILLWVVRSLMPGDSPAAICLSVAVASALALTVSLRLFASSLCLDLWSRLRGLKDVKATAVRGDSTLSE